MTDSGQTARDSRSLRRGRIPGGAPGEAAFRLRLPRGAPAPVLLATPHSGRAYPPNLVEAMRHPAAAALRLEDRFIDLVAEAVARETGAGLLVAHAPRAMIDLNRAPDDIDWDMVAGAIPERNARMAAGRRARSGLGLVPRRLPGLGELWRRRMTEIELADRIERIHRPYHAALAETLEMLRDRWGAALLLDLHSMPPLTASRGTQAAMFVVGDRFGASASPALSAVAMDHFTGEGWRAAHNRPYAGGYVLERHGAPARGLHALQVEVCRSAYLDDALREPGAGLAEVARVLAGLVRRMADELFAGRPVKQAAE